MMGGIALGERIAVLSGKGGTGKTSICAAVATALAQQKKRVLCLDCDIGLRNLDISLGLSELAALSFLDVCQGGYSLAQATEHPRFPGLFFLTAPMNCTAQSVDVAAFHAMLREAQRQYDYIFLDAPAGVETGFHLAAAAADRVLLVTLADPAAIRDAGRAGELLELMGKKQVRLVVNRIDPRMVSNMALTVDDIMDRAGLPLAGIVPEDSSVTLAAALGQPLLCYSKKGAAAACRRIAARLQGIPTPVTI